MSNSTKRFYLLSVDIFKTLSLKKEHRPIPAKEYLDKQFNCYCKLIESSDTIKKIIKINYKLLIILLLKIIL